MKIEDVLIYFFFTLLIAIILWLSIQAAYNHDPNKLCEQIYPSHETYRGVTECMLKINGKWYPSSNVIIKGE